MAGHQTTIDPGGEGEVRVTGYCTSTLRLLPTALLTLLTGGLPLLVFRWRPSWRLALTSHPTSLARADRVLVEHKESGDTSLEAVVEEEVGAGEQVPGEYVLRGEAAHHSDRTHLLEEGGGATIRYFTSRHTRYQLTLTRLTPDLISTSSASMSCRYIWRSRGFHALAGLTPHTGGQLLAGVGGLPRDRWTPRPGTSPGPRASGGSTGGTPSPWPSPPTSPCSSTRSDATPR